MRDAVSVRNVEKEAQINQIETHPTIPSSSSTQVAEMEGSSRELACSTFPRKRAR
jgi:hypothetical protein